MKLLRPFLQLVFVVVLCGLFLPGSSPLRGQSTQSAVPQWQIDAGGKIVFEVASVKENLAGPLTESRSNFALDSNLVELPVSTGGFLSATNFPLLQYIAFAFRLDASQTKSVQSQLPKWVNTKRYDIVARAPGNPTKDQFRLMMQSLLANRFGLSSHFKKRELPVFDLVLGKPGRLGPQLRLHPSGTDCSGESVAIPGRWSYCRWVSRSLRRTLRQPVKGRTRPHSCRRSKRYDGCHYRCFGLFLDGWHRSPGLG